MKRRSRTIHAALALAALCSMQGALVAAPQEPGAETERPLLPVSIGHTEIVEPGWMVKEAVVADPEIADVKVVNPERVMIVASAVGSTDVSLWGEDGQSWHARVVVQRDMEHLRLGLAQALPDAELEITASGEVVIVAGTLRRAEHAEAMSRYLQAAGVNFVDMTKVAGLQQVMIKVRVAEANRVAIRSLGVNALHSGDGFFGGSTIGGNTSSINAGVPADTPVSDNLPFQFLSNSNVGDAVTLFAGFPDIDLQLFLEALEENQYIRTLAEPTLVALSGEKASFLAGGEFPIPVAQGAGIGGGTTVTIEYKEFGVRLNFLPTVLGDGAIRLQVAPEVSDLSEIGAVEIEGFRIPSLLTRRAATTLVMKSGQTFAMAGLIDRSVAARSERVPGLGALPILGPLFRSVRYERGDTELVVLATVELVEPIDLQAELPVPGDTHSEPGDWELYMDGRIQGDPNHRARPVVTWAEDLGLDRLRGPGAWARHDQERKPVLRPAPGPIPPWSTSEEQAAATAPDPAPHAPQPAPVEGPQTAAVETDQP